MSDFSSRGSRGAPRQARWLRFAWLSAPLGWSNAALGQSELVTVTCPQLDREQAAEIEARVRASLLTTETPATVAISCESESAHVRIEASSSDVALETLAMSANLREELIGALDRAFAKLAGSSAALEAATVDAPDPTAMAPEPAAAEVVPTRPTAVKRAALVAPPHTTASTRSERPATVFVRAPSAPLFAQGVGELWSTQLAWGAELGSEWSLGSLRYGARAGLLAPVATEPTFTVLDWEGMLHVGARPSGWANLQLTLGLGVAWMVVSPRGEATSHGVSTVRAPFALVALSRPTRLGPLAIVPELGARLFGAERGVRADDRESVRFGWIAPRLALAVSYLSD